MHSQIQFRRTMTSNRFSLALPLVKKRIGVSFFIASRLIAEVVILAIFFLTTSVAPAASQFCHITDGTFSNCGSGEALEWSDVVPIFFPDSNSYLYADQADLDPLLGSPTSPLDTFVLMYDEVARTTPLGPDDYFLVSFSTVEVEDGKEKLNFYNIHIFTDGTIIFFENGELEHDKNGNYRVHEIEGQRGKVGFAPSPNSAVPHVIAEFEIKLSSSGAIVNGAYSPEPQFWTSEPPPCDVPPLPELSGTALELENGRPAETRTTANGNTFTVGPRALVDELSAATQQALNNFVDGIAATPGATTPTVTSAFRPQEYQDHLRAIREAADHFGAQYGPNGAIIGFTNGSDECNERLTQIQTEANRHGLNGNPVAIHSNHSSRIAFDLSSNLSVSVLRQLAQLAGLTLLVEPHGLHFTLTGSPATPPAASVTVHSPIAVLLTDPQGRRIGSQFFSSAINELGSVATFTGPSIEPQVIHLSATVPGDYLITAIGTGNGPYKIELRTGGEDAGVLDSAPDSNQFASTLDFAVVEGIASLGKLTAPIKATITESGVIKIEVLAEPPTPPLVQGLINGGFETGDFSGWTQINSGSGGIVIDNGTFVAPGASGPVAPFEGSFASATFQSGPGVHTLFQDVDLADNLKSASVRWADNLQNFNGAFSHPNQEWRLQVLDPISNTVLATLFSTQPGDPPFQDWTVRTADLHSWIGQKIRLAFTEEDNLFFFNARLDAVAVITDGGDVPPTIADKDGDGIPDELDNSPSIFNPDQRDSDFNGIGDASQSPIQKHGTAAFLQAGFDGNTIVDQRPTSIAQEPTQVVEITQTVINDVSPCTITCPANIVTRNDPGVCGAIVNYPPPVVNGPCGPATSTPTSGSFFPVGVTTVTCMDTRGNSCSFTVTVNDMEGPHISCLVGKNSLWPLDHKLVNVRFSVTAIDNCDGSIPPTLRIFSDEDELAPASGRFSPDAKNVAPGTLSVRSECRADGDGRVYLVVATVSDAAGNRSFACCTVTVPHDQSASSIASVANQAVAAEAYCRAHDGAPPGGFFPIGNGPEAGPNQ